MEQICRRFVWSKNAQGKDKIPLLAREDLQPAKREGGLGIPSFALQGDAQKLRQVLRMMHRLGEDWMLALGALLKWMIVKKRWAVTMRDWEVEEILMAKCPNSISGAKTATGLLKVWAKAKTRLELLRKDFTPQGEMSTEVAIVIGEQQGWFMTVEAKEIKATLRKHKVKTIGHWTDWAFWNDARRPLPQREQRTVEAGLEFFPTSTPIQSLPWNWKSKKRRGEWFTMTTKECKNIVGITRQTADSLNRKWGRSERPRQWSKRFQRIWKSTLAIKDKLWLWKILNLGIPTLNRMQKIGHGDGVCTHCRNAIETPEHLLWQCKDTVERWRDLRYLTERLSCHITQADCFIDAVDAAFRGQDPGKLVPFTLMTRATWLDRNQMTYAQQRQCTPVSITLKRAVEVMDTLRWRLDPSTKTARKLETAEKTIQIAANRAGESEMTIEISMQSGGVDNEDGRGGREQDSPSLASCHEEQDENNIYSDVGWRSVKNAQEERTASLRIDSRGEEGGREGV
ncbi:hypothetical protein R1flu_014053 [Riccia fluitans]|uniref:Reverse transcriptase zinc-binding domain-containing protein n=1 Tax=Riccia fluitans TaxID=41844 RepID=A0ABD1YI53_9MARC